MTSFKRSLHLHVQTKEPPGNVPVPFELIQGQAVASRGWAEGKASKRLFVPMGLGGGGRGTETGIGGESKDALLLENVVRISILQTHFIVL